MLIYLALHLYKAAPVSGFSTRRTAQLKKVESWGKLCEHVMWQVVARASVVQGVLGRS